MITFNEQAFSQHLEKERKSKSYFQRFALWHYVNKLGIQQIALLVSSYFSFNFWSEFTPNIYQALIVTAVITLIIWVVIEQIKKQYRLKNTMNPSILFNFGILFSF